LYKQLNIQLGLRCCLQRFFVAVHTG